MASIKRIGKDKYGMPIWEAYYRRTPKGKLVKKRFHLPTKADVEHAVHIDSQRSDVGVKWSEGSRLYLDAKLAEGRSRRGMENVDRAVQMFIQIMGDMAVEETSAILLKQFMHAVATQPIRSMVTGRSRVSGPKVANHHRKELFTVANYLLRHTGKISVIPFATVPPLPVKRVRREPVPQDKVQTYLDALPDHVRRPLLLVLFYGLRSSAICNILESSIEPEHLVAIDKNSVERRIPLDPMLRKIVEEALAYKRKFTARTYPNLFLNTAGRPWNRITLLRASQRAWELAGLEKKKIHEFRHTLGTVASKSFTPGMVQALMGHQSRKSSETYFHPNEDMAVVARSQIIAEITNGGQEHTLQFNEDGRYECPCCGVKIRIAGSPKQPRRKKVTKKVTELAEFDGI